VGECFFWYWPTQVVPDKGPLNGCVHVCCVMWLTGLSSHSVAVHAVTAVVDSSGIDGCLVCNPQCYGVSPQSCRWTFLSLWSPALLWRTLSCTYNQLYVAQTHLLSKMSLCVSSLMKMASHGCSRLCCDGGQTDRASMFWAGRPRSVYATVLRPTFYAVLFCIVFMIFNFSIRPIFICVNHLSLSLLL